MTKPVVADTRQQSQFQMHLTAAAVSAKHGPVSPLGSIRSLLQ